MYNIRKLLLLRHLYNICFKGKSVEILIIK
jgi:hypothetical protein